MKNLIVFLFLCIAPLIAYSQNKVQVDAIYGQLIEHDKKLAAAIDGNISGMFITWNTTRSKNEAFNQHYNSPEKGFSLLYENLNSNVLGKAYSAYRHYSFFLNKRNNQNKFKLITGAGLAYITRPYDVVDNPNNHAIGSHILLAGFAKLDYLRHQLIGNWGVQVGLGLYHYSNSAFNNPNLGLNTIAVHAGINYNFEEKTVKTPSTFDAIPPFQKQPIYYNLVFRGGVNESKIINSGLYSFYTLTAYASKQINWFSTITAGTDLIYSNFIPRYANYQNKHEGENLVTNNRFRLGIFAGHELQLDSFGMITQIGYYAYNPTHYITNIYERIGFRHQINNHIFTALTLRVNLFRAEALEFGLGIRF